MFKSMNYPVACLIVFSVSPLLLLGCRDSSKPELTNLTNQSSNVDATTTDQNVAMPEKLVASFRQRKDAARPDAIEKNARKRLLQEKAKPKSVDIPPSLKEFREILRHDSTVTASSKPASVSNAVEALLKKHEKRVRGYLVELAIDPEVGSAASAFISDAEEQFGLGWDYESGFYTQQDFKQALAWYKKSAEQGYEPGKQKLVYFDELQKKIINKREAIRARKTGIIDSQNPLGQAISRANVQWEFLRRTKERYSQQSSGGFGPFRQATNAGNFAASREVARDMEALAMKIAQLQKQYDQEFEAKHSLTTEEKQFAAAMNLGY